MMFVYPSFLWALFAVALPVIIHLFNFRKYKKVYFTNVRFLKELQLESKSRSRLRELLILIARCLAVAALVLAFAQPVYNATGTSVSAGARHLSLYIDNSFSMQNVNRQGALLEIAKTRAKEIIRLFGNNGRFQLITNDFEGRHQRFNTWENALELVDEIKISPLTRPVTDVYRRQQEFLNTSGGNNKMAYLLSDAQRSTFNINLLAPDTGILTSILPIASNQVNNVYLDTCWFEDPLQQKGFIQKLHARVQNSSDLPINAGSAKLFLNNQQVAISSFSLEARASDELVFTFECKSSGFHFGSVKITDYPVTFDDELFFAFNSRVNVSVCLVNGKDQPSANHFSSLFLNDSLFSFRSFGEQAIDYNFFKSSDVIVLNQLSELSTGLVAELIKFCSKGGALVLIPSEIPEPQSYQAALSSLKLPMLGEADTTAVRTENIEDATGFYSGVFARMEERINLPVVNRHFRFRKGSRNSFQSVLKLQNGDDFFGYTRLNNGAVYLFASPLSGESTNFSKHALFVPTFYQLCFKSLIPFPLFFHVSENVVIPLRADLSGEQPPHIRHLSGAPDIIPELRVVNSSMFLRTGQQITVPGFYQILKNDSALHPLAFNYQRAESELLCYTPEELDEILRAKAWKKVRLIGDSEGSLSKQVLMGAEGQKLWKIFIILALLFLTIELVLLRLLK